MYFQPLAVVAFASAALAQTYSSCNPTENTTCSPDKGLNQASYSVDFTQGASDDWIMTYQNVTYDSTNGATFEISASGDAPTMGADFYMFFGSVSVTMKAAAGTGIVSCFILESDDLDEIDWEWVGGDVDQVESNYFGKGNTTSYDRAIWYNMGDTQSDWHNYTIDWTKERINWMVDGSVIRTLEYADAVSGTNYPQTPMNIRLGMWAGGDPTEPEGTIEWAGGETDYTAGPFYMYVSKIEINNANPAPSYTWGDQTGDYSSIEMDATDESDTGSSSSSASKSASATATKTSLASIFSQTSASNSSTDAPSQGSSTSNASATGGSSAAAGSTGSAASSSTTSPVTAGAPAGIAANFLVLALALIFCL